MRLTKRFYDRIFGSGPAIAAASGICLLIGWAIARATPAAGWANSPDVRFAVLGAGSLLALVVIAWSVHTLRPERRGTELVVGGPFRFVRHPLYAACLSLFGPSLVIALAHPAYAGALVLIHLLANRLVRREEAMMAAIFPQAYLAYCAHTGRFWPRIHVGRPTKA
tara:strand:+ start:1806 stop:2303 length:498 start_codon:yes stop_codon:yes gene_type:complete